MSIAVGFGREALTRLRPGDIVSTWSTSTVSKIIRMGSTHPGEADTLPSHTALVQDPWTLIESVAKGTTVNAIGTLDNAFGSAVAFRIPGLTMGDRTSMVLEALRYVGKSYPYSKVFLLHGLDWLFFHGAYVARRFAFTDRPYCTSLVVAAGRAADADAAHFPWDLDEVQPDDLLDYQVRKGHELVWVDKLETLQQLLEVYPSLAPQIGAHLEAA